MTKTKIEQAKKHLAKIRELIAKNPTPIFRMSKEDMIKSLRKTRQTIWEEKLASSH